VLPKVTIHNEISVDGRITGSSSDLHRYYLVGHRWHPDAILMGCDTVLAAFQAADAEDETQPERLVPPEDLDASRRGPLPLLAVPDSRGRIRSWPLLLQEPWWREIVALCTERTPRPYFEYLDELGIDYLVAGQERVDLRQALELLNERYEISSVLTDCGGALNGALFRAGLVTEVSVLVTPSLVGGPPNSTLVDCAQPLHEGEPVRLQFKQLEKFEDGAIWLRYDVLPVPALAQG
jgi:2,5-diamino-6-(ribosylamino)-4(3H)-pyrimidinone 5'-phosphate reductase